MASKTVAQSFVTSQMLLVLLERTKVAEMIQKSFEIPRGEYISTVASFEKQMEDFNEEETKVNEENE